MKKKITALFTILFISAFIAHCNLIQKKPFDFYDLNFNDSLIIKVNKISIHNKAMLINDSVVLYKSSRLIFESHDPKWLFEKTKNKELFKNEYIYFPEISDIEAPYVLMKTKKTNVFQIIKDQDTLNFDFENFDELDY